MLRAGFVAFVMDKPKEEVSTKSLKASETTLPIRQKSVNIPISW